MVYLLNKIMKNYIVLILFFYVNLGFSQTEIFENIDKQIKIQDKIRIDISNLDSVTQIGIIEFSQKYNTDTTIREMLIARDFICSSFEKSKYISVKQKVVNYILGLHRCTMSPLNWYSYADYKYFDSAAKAKILRIVKKEPLSDYERSFHEYLNKELVTQQIKNKLEYIKEISKEENVPFEEVKNKMILELEDNLNYNVNPRNYINDYILILTGYLDIKEAIPYIKIEIEEYNPKKDLAQIDAYKVVLARLGMTEFQEGFIANCISTFNNNPEMFKDANYDNTLIPTQLGYIASQESIESFLVGIKSKAFYNKPSVTEDVYYQINRLYLDYFTQYVLNFPFHYGEYIFREDVYASDKNLKAAIKWIEENKGKYVINRQKWIWPLK